MNFTEKNLRAALSGKKIGEPLYFFSSVESTNQLAFNIAGEGASEGTVIVADHQTRGRGRMQRVWQSPPALNLYISVILRPALAPAFSSPLTIMAGVAIFDVLAGYCPQVRLKWPNDVLINNKKVCGILTEIKTIGNKIDFVIIGIGININMQIDDLLPSLAPIATSLRVETGKPLDRVDLTVKLLERMGAFYASFLTEGINPLRELWLSAAQLVGRLVEVTFGAEVYRGIVSGMDDSGALMIMDEMGEKQRIIAGDLKVIKGSLCC